MSGKRKRTQRDGDGAKRSAGVPVDLMLATADRLQRAGDAAGAEAAYRQVLAARPHDERATQLLGAILAERGALDEAIERFEAAVTEVGPPSVATLGFYNNYANTLRRAGRLVSAEEILRALTESAPREWQPWHNLGQTLKDCERYDEAAAAMRRAVMLAPEFGPNHAVLGEILHHLGRLRSAAASFQRAVDLGWVNDHATWTAYGNNKRMLGELDDALEMIMRALVLTGGSAAAHSNAGVVLMQLGRMGEAIDHFRQAIAGEPENNTYHGYLGYALLASGRLPEAFDPWERAIQNGLRGTERETGVPRWTLDDRDARVLVYREQGVGDEIMLASMYPDLVAATREVVVECDTRLVPLFARSFPGAEVRAQTIDARGCETRRDFDRATAAGSLIRWFRPTLAAFPDRAAYLRADPERVAAWRARLAEIAPGPYVGISWRSRVRTAERRLEYTRLDEWGGIFATRGVTWVNLQYDDCNRELRAAEHEFGVRIARWDELDLMNDFDEVAALTTALDLVVAPQNAVAMLSGALGVRTVSMGTRYGWAEMGTGRMPWMPTIVGAFRSPAHEDWSGPLAVAAREVAAVAAPAPERAPRDVTV